MLGMIVRDDQGGLGYLTRTLARQIRPDVVLVVQHDPPRGQRVAADGLAPDMRTVRLGDGLAISDDARRWFTDRCDTAVSCETWYDWRLAADLERAGVRRLLYAMPELHDPNDGRLAADGYAWPTGWRAPDGAHILPFPGDPGPHRTRTEGGEHVRFLHVSSTAMADRNGTKLVEAAHRGAPRLDLTTVGGDHHVQAIAWADYDVLVLPRRYGGLCLPFIEAAAHGLAIVTLDVPPQCDYGWAADCYVEATEPHPRMMKGGRVDVWQADPADLARHLAALAVDPGRVERAAVSCRWWHAAQQDAWTRWRAWVA